MRKNHKTLVCQRPDVAAQLHPALNGDLDITKITVSSKMKVWWQCSGCQCCGLKHSYEALVCSRTRPKATGCPSCGKRNPCENGCGSLADERPDIAVQLHPTLNDLDPTRIMVSSGKKAWWQCFGCRGCGLKHSYEALIGHRTKWNGTGCPKCSIPQYQICENGCGSLAKERPDIALQLHPTLNSDFDPTKISVSSHIILWWLCNGCRLCGLKHAYEAKISDRTRLNGSNCSICCRSPQKVCENGCGSLAKERPDIALQLHPTLNGHIDSSKILVSSSMKLWWQCSGCKCCGLKHSFESVVNDRTTSNGTGCPACSVPQKKVCENGCGSLAYERPDIAVQLHPTRNHAFDPHNVMVSSHIIVWWQCEKNEEHYWKTAISQRTVQNGTNCPFCKQSKGEREIAKWLDIHNMSHEFEFNIFVNGHNFRPYRLDFYVPSHRCAIEFDGKFHFEPRHTDDDNDDILKRQTRDKNKTLYCANNSHLFDWFVRIHFQDKDNISELLSRIFSTHHTLAEKQTHLHDIGAFVYVVNQCVLVYSQSYPENLQFDTLMFLTAQ